MTLALALAGAIAAAQGAPPPTLAELLDRVGRYVRGFQQEFSTVISDETYVQHDESCCSSAFGRKSISERRLESEMLFQFTPAEQAWLLVRNVLKVNQEPVPDSRARLDAVLADPSSGAAGRLRKLRDEGARFNIGTIRRNMNDPMLPLQVVDPAFQQRFTFAIAGRDKVSGIDAWKLTFAEERVPTIVEIDGQNARAHGALWVTASGIILRTTFALEEKASNLSVAMTVSYGRNAKMGGWVPTRMDEKYSQEQKTGMRGTREEISCVAYYSNFRRFETSARILR